MHSGCWGSKVSIQKGLGESDHYAVGGRTLSDCSVRLFSNMPTILNTNLKGSWPA